MSPKNKIKLKLLRKKLDKIDNQLLIVVKKRTEIVKKVLSLKSKKKEIVDKKRISAVLKKIRNESLKKNIEGGVWGGGPGQTYQGRGVGYQGDGGGGGGGGEGGEGEGAEVKSRTITTRVRKHNTGKLLTGGCVDVCICGLVVGFIFVQKVFIF